MASAYVNKSMDHNSESMAQYPDHLAKLLKETEARAGLAGGTLSVGSLDLTLDTDYQDMDYS
jgi:hypothetical protein